MIKKRKKSTFKKTLPRKKLTCPICKGAELPSYKNYKNLQNYLTDRAKIVPRLQSGICSKHQRRLALEIKRARHLGLLPFTPQA